LAANEVKMNKPKNRFRATQLTLGVLASLTLSQVAIAQDSQNEEDVLDEVVTTGTRLKVRLLRLSKNAKIKRLLPIS